MFESLIVAHSYAAHVCSDHPSVSNSFGFSPVIVSEAHEALKLIDIMKAANPDNLKPYFKIAADSISPPSSISNPTDYSSRLLGSTFAFVFKSDIPTAMLRYLSVAAH